MKKPSKRYLESKKAMDTSRPYALGEAVSILKKGNPCKFDETVELSVRLGVDPRQADQMVRGSTKLPHGTGRTLRVVAIAKGEKAKEAQAQGADHVGAEDVVEKIKGGWLDFDKVVATPDMMAQVGKLGQILGPRGLMPNPKSGTVTMEIGKAVQELKAGKIDYRVDKTGIIHTIAGKASFEEKKLKENIQTLMESVVKAKPSAAKGVYIKSVTLSTTMGPGVKVDPTGFAA